MTALITTSDSLKALTIVRSLGRKGISVTTGSSHPFSLASSSKYSNNSMIYPSPLKNPGEFIKVIRHYLENNPHDLLIPVHSEDTFILARYASSFSGITHFPFQNAEDMIKVNDKSNLAHIAKELDIPVPKTWIPHELSDINSISREIRFPAVIKLRDRTSSVGQSYVYSPDELVRVYCNTVHTYNLTPLEYPIIQEFISGTGFGVSLLYNNGDLRARFTHKRLREFPVSGGPSTCRISTRHQKMEEYATRLLEHFSWHGVAMVEFKLGTDNIPYLLEVNPRFWGSINQAIRSGVDFPYLLYQMTIEGDIRPVLSYREGVVTRNCMLDICSLFLGLRRKDSFQCQNPCIQFPFYDDIFSPDDPIPGLLSVCSAMRHIFQKSGKKGYS